MIFNAMILQNANFLHLCFQSLQVFIKKVEKVREQSKVQFPDIVISVLWENIITLVVRVLIEG